MAETPAEQDSPTLKGIYLWVRSSIVLICFLLACVAIYRGIDIMENKDRRNREDLNRERDISRQDMDRELDRYRQERMTTADWHRKGQESIANRLGTLTAKIEALEAAVKRLEGKADVALMGAELLPMPRESKP